MKTLKTALLGSVLSILLWGPPTKSMVSTSARGTRRLKLPPSAELLSGADCDHGHNSLADRQCETYVFEHYGTEAGYSYIARVRPFYEARQKKEDEAREAAKAAEAEKWRAGVKGVVHGVSVVQAQL
jgi:hypothetical protein